jgi:lactate permease
VWTFLSALPLIVILAAMLLLRRSAAQAGLIGLAVTVALAVRFRAEGGMWLYMGSFAEAAFVTATILWIVVPALFLYRLQLLSGSIDSLREWLGSLSHDPRIVALVIGWFFALFLEGAAGFGTPIALAAPLLVAAGFSPVAAVAIALVGHGSGVVFGAIGTPMLPLIEASGLPALQLARHVAISSAVIAPLLLGGLLLLVSRDIGSERHGLRGIASYAALALIAFLVPFLLVAFTIGPELPTLMGAVAGGALFTGLLLRKQRASTRAGSIAAVATPYLLLITLVLVTRLVPTVSELTTSLELRWSLFDQFEGSFRPLHQPGSLLMLAIAGALLIRPLPRETLRVAAIDTMRRIAPVVVALGAMLALARLMVHSGMISTLADAAVVIAAAGWPLVSPAVGAVGSFITGSATTSNILFSELQFSTARSLDLPTPVMAGAQAVGGALGNMICPHNIIAGAATVGAAGREAEILRRTLPLCLIGLALAGIVTWLQA